jgi:hypothetical protein
MSISMNQQFHDVASIHWGKPTEQSSPRILTIKFRSGGYVEIALFPSKNAPTPELHMVDVEPEAA